MIERTDPIVDVTCVSCGRPLSPAISRPFGTDDVKGAGTDLGVGTRNAGAQLFSCGEARAAAINRRDALLKETGWCHHRGRLLPVEALTTVHRDNCERQRAEGRAPPAGRTAGLAARDYQGHDPRIRAGRIRPHGAPTC